MSTEFSQASRLIVRNLNIVKEIHKAEGELAECLRKFLFTFKSRFEQCRWWGDKWHLKLENDTQIYLAHSAWKRADEYAIWIGIESFSVEAVFGTDPTSALLYVWVSGQRPQLVSALRRNLGEETDIKGDVQTKANSAYVVQKRLRKCLPEELDTFDDVVVAPVLDFFSCYAEREEEFTRILNDIEIQQPPKRDK